MSTYFTLDEANERLGDARELLLLLRDQRDELVTLRDRYVSLTGRPLGEPEPVRKSEARSAERGEEPRTGDATTLTEREEAERIRLRIRGIVDQMGASVTRLDGWGITLRDIPSGLIDFPALVAGRPVWLCWRLADGEGIAWWHEHDAGVAGRQPLGDLA